MSHIPKISEAEWEVMKAVWEKSPITANEVVERLSHDRDWSPRTVKAMLNHLLKKGALTFQMVGNRYFYLPKVTKDKCVKSESLSFMKRVFDGAASSMLVHLVQNTKLSSPEREQLRKILKTETKQ